MGLPGAVNYILYDNPLCKSATDYIVQGGTWLGMFKKPAVSPKGSKMVSTSAVTPKLYELARAGGPFIRIAGLSGAAAVALGAYGAHTIYLKDISQERKNAFETANRYHFLHTLALLGVPLCRRPALSGWLMVSGTLLFCGSCYHFSVTGDTTLKPATPYGGMILIAAWLSLLL